MATFIYQFGTTNLQGFATQERKLYLLVSPTEVFIVFWDIPTNQAISVEMFADCQDWDTAWEEIKQQSVLLALRHIEAMVYYSYARAMLIPPVFFEAQTAQHQLNILFGDPQTEWYVGANLIPSGDAVVVWQIPMGIYQSLSQHFSQITHGHIAFELVKPFLGTENHNTLGQILLLGQIAWVLIWDKRLLTVKSVMLTPGTFEYDLVNLTQQWGIDKFNIRWHAKGFTHNPSWLLQSANQLFPHFRYQQQEEADNTKGLKNLIQFMVHNSQNQENFNVTS